MAIFEYCNNTERLFLTLLLYQLTAVTSVPTQWTCYGETGSCYYLSGKTSSRLKALCSCQADGGDLVKIDSQEELNVIIYNLLAPENRTKGYFTGGSDLKVEGRFVWDDGTDVEHRPVWYPEEPNNYGNQDNCLVISRFLWFSRSTAGYIPEYQSFDVNCEARQYHICEKRTGQLSFSRFWEEKSRGVIYPSAQIQSVSGEDQMTCASLCMKTCGCFSMAYKEDGGNCLLYNSHYSRLTGPLNVSEFVNYG